MQCIVFGKQAFKYVWGVGVSWKAYTADAWEVFARMLTLGIGGVGKLGPRTKRLMYEDWNDH